jgi:hypothetical protein
MGTQLGPLEIAIRCSGGASVPALRFTGGRFRVVSGSPPPGTGARLSKPRRIAMRIYKYRYLDQITLAAEQDRSTLRFAYRSGFPLVPERDFVYSAPGFNLGQSVGG